MNRTPGPGAPVIGVLGLQGDVREHISALKECSSPVVVVRVPGDLEGIDALVLPGGESTTLVKLLQWSELFDPIKARLDAGMPALGTCAGMILLAKTILDGRSDQVSFGAIDIAVRRNAFGPQAESFEADLAVSGVVGPPMHAVFIRAPIVEVVGEGVDVLASVDVEAGVMHPVVCRSGRVTVASFHPELSGDVRLHVLLIEDARAAVANRGA